MSGDDDTAAESGHVPWAERPWTPDSEDAVARFEAHTGAPLAAFLDAVVAQFAPLRFKAASWREVIDIAKEIVAAERVEARPLSIDDCVFATAWLLEDCYTLRPNASPTCDDLWDIHVHAVYAVAALGLGPGRMEPFVQRVIGAGGALQTWVTDVLPPVPELLHEVVAGFTSEYMADPDTKNAVMDEAVSVVDGKLPDDRRRALFRVGLEWHLRPGRLPCRGPGLARAIARFRKVANWPEPLEDEVMATAGANLAQRLTGTSEAAGDGAMKWLCANSKGFLGWSEWRLRNHFAAAKKRAPKGQPAKAGGIEVDVEGHRPDDGLLSLEAVDVSDRAWEELQELRDARADDPGTLAAVKYLMEPKTSLKAAGAAFGVSKDVVQNRRDKLLSELARRIAKH